MWIVELKLKNRIVRLVGHAHGREDSLIDPRVGTVIKYEALHLINMYVTTM